MRSTRSRLLLTALSLVVLGAVFMWWTLPRPVGISDAKRSEDGQSWVVYIERCNSERSVEVAENGAVVLVIVRADRGTRDDCLDAVTFQLDAPLGDRLIIDGSDFDPIDARVSELGAAG